MTIEFITPLGLARALRREGPPIRGVDGPPANISDAAGGPPIRPTGVVSSQVIHRGPPLPDSDIG
ncbi:MAG: hypothetical protein RIS35_3391 [Pseudomonadota bacterium]|jgi:hypothetical protein